MFLTRLVGVTVTVTGSRFGWVEEEGLTGGVEDGLRSGLTEDESTGRVEEGLNNGSTEAGSIESTEEEEEGVGEGGTEGMPVEDGSIGVFG